MTNLHEDIILDLLPLYFANEASAASVVLIDNYFAAHPQFAASARAAHGHSIPIPPRPPETSIWASGKYIVARPAAERRSSKNASVNAVTL